MEKEKPALAPTPAPLVTLRRIVLGKGAARPAPDLAVGWRLR